MAIRVAELLFRLLAPATPVTEAVGVAMQAYCAAVFAILIHRWILLGEIDIRAALGRRAVFFVGLAFAEAILIALAPLVVFIPVAPIGGVVTDLFGRAVVLTAGVYLAFAATAAAAVIVTACFIAVFPALAATRLEKLSFNTVRSGVEAGRRAVWETAKRLVVFGVAALAFLLVAGAVMPDPPADPGDGGAAHMLVAYLGTVLSYAPLAFFVALASFIYRRFIEELQAQGRGA